MTTAPTNGQFGPNYFYVQTTQEQDEGQTGTVAAKYLQDSNGDYVINPATNRPYVVPEDYNPAAVIQHFQALAAQNVDAAESSGSMSAEGNPMAAAAAQTLTAFNQFASGQPYDLQTAYNGTVNNQFVRAFTPAASYNLGLAAAAAGISPFETLAGGGVYNLTKFLLVENVNIGGYIFNNPKNVPNINDGFNGYSSGLFSPQTQVVGDVSFASSSSGSGYVDTVQYGNSTVAVSPTSPSQGAFDISSNYTSNGSVAFQLTSMNADGTVSQSSSFANGAVTIA